MPPSIPLALLAVAAILACGEPPAQPTRRGSLVDSADVLMFGATSTLTASGVRRGELEADTVMGFDEATRYELRPVRVRFYSVAGLSTATLTAREGTYQPAPGVMEARGNVVIVADTGGRRLETERLRYDAASDEISSDTAFVATAPGRRLSGEGFVADPGLRNVRCLRACSGSLGR